MTTVELYADHNLCSGCRACLLACSLENFQEMTPAKSALRVQPLFPAPGRYRVHLCDQCGRCAEVCPMEAITRQNGTWLVDPEECTSCGTCVEECPHGVITLPRDEDPAVKCTGCGACVEICPRDVLSWQEGPTKEVHP